MKASHENSRRFADPLPAILVAVDGALRDIGAKLSEHSSDPWKFHAEVSINFIVDSLFIEVGNEGEVSIRCSSTSRWPFYGPLRHVETCRIFLECVSSRLVDHRAAKHPASPPD